MTGPLPAPSRHSTVVAADVGRTSCRAACYREAVAGPVHRTTSGSSLADPRGVAALSDVVLAATEQVLDRAVPDVVAVGVTGAAQDPVAARGLAAAIQAHFPLARVLVTTDVVTAHAGALAAAPGVVMVAGTGAVALAARQEAAPRVVDGAGWLLGDDGGGVWIGRAGLRSALRWHDGREGGSTELAWAAQARFGPLAQLVEHVQGELNPARLLASFTPDVLDLAGRGEAEARRIVASAVMELTATTAAACRTWSPEHDLAISYAGGLFERMDLVTAPWEDAVTRAVPRGRVQGPAGDALDGAYRLVVTQPGLYGELMHDLPPAREGPNRSATR